MKKTKYGSMTEKKCCKCGSKIIDAGTKIGQCSNKKCKTEHTVILPLAREDLSDCQYKDYYG